MFPNICLEYVPERQWWFSFYSGIFTFS